MAERTVKVIEPTIGILNQSKIIKTAAYCRVSTNSEDQVNSFSAQLKYYTEYISSNPRMELVDIYADVYSFKQNHYNRHAENSC